MPTLTASTTPEQPHNGYGKMTTTKSRMKRIRQQNAKKPFIRKAKLPQPKKRKRFFSAELEEYKVGL